MAKMMEQESTHEETRIAIKDSHKITHITAKFLNITDIPEI